MACMIGCLVSKSMLINFYGYYSNAMKILLIVKPAFLSDAQQVFEGTSVQVTAEGKGYLGLAFGTQLFTEQYVSKKVESWSCCIVKLSDIVNIYVHTAYTTFTHGLHLRMQ